MSAILNQIYWDQNSYFQKKKNLRAGVLNFFPNLKLGMFSSVSTSCKNDPLLLLDKEFVPSKVQSEFFFLFLFFTEIFINDGNIGRLHLSETWEELMIRKPDG